MGWFVELMMQHTLSFYQEPTVTTLLASKQNFLELIEMKKESILIISFFFFAHLFVVPSY